MSAEYKTPEKKKQKLLQFPFLDFPMFLNIFDFPTFESEILKWKL